MIGLSLSSTGSSDRNFVVTDRKEWIDERAQAGRLPLKGFPKSNRFGQATLSGRVRQKAPGTSGLAPVRA